MGHFLGLGNRQIYVDNDGTYWESEHKRVRFSEKELFPEKFTSEATITASEVTTTVTETPVEEKKETIQEAIDKLTCSVCKYQAKSIAGLAQHKLIKKHGSFSLTDVK